jgi:lipopolysaccharide export system permease protein
MILSLYIARRFLWMVARVFAAFMGLLLLIETIEQLRRFSDQGISLGQGFHLAALAMPETLYTILPLIVILSAIALFMGLARSSELVVIRAAGRSGLRFLVTPVIVACAIGVLAVAVMNPLVAATTKEYDLLWAKLKRGSDSVLSVSGEGLWLRQGGTDGQTVIHAGRANSDGTELYAVTFQTFGADGLALARIEAETARLEPGAWVLSGAKRWDLRQANPETVVDLSDALRLSSDLTRERIRDSFGTPGAIPVWGLPSYIAGLERAGFSARSYRVWLQMELALPFLLAAMVLVAAGFTMRHARFGKTGTMVILALGGGFAIFFLRNFAQVLGDNGQIPIAMAAWTPPLAAALFATGLLLHLEDG